MPRRCRCGTTENVRVYPMWPRKLFLCKNCAADHFKAKRREETTRLLADYGDTDRAALWAEAHHIALKAVTLDGLVCTPQTEDDIRWCLAALDGQSVRYFHQFADQAFRVFPSYRDRQRARGHASRAADRHAYRLAYDVPWLRRLYRDRCAYCGTTSAHIDHMWPLVLGGDDAPWNVAPACDTCNLGKGARQLGEWLPGRLAELPDTTRNAARERWHTWASL